MTAGSYDHGGRLVRADFGRLLRQSHRRLGVPGGRHAARARRPRLVLALVLLVWGGGHADTGLAAPSAKPDPHPAAAGSTRTPAPDPYGETAPPASTESSPPTTVTEPATPVVSSRDTSSAGRESQAPTAARAPAPKPKKPLRAKPARPEPVRAGPAAKVKTPPAAVAASTDGGRLFVGGLALGVLALASGEPAGAHDPRRRDGAEIVTARRLATALTLSLLGALALPGSTAAAVPSPPDPICSPGPADCHEWHSAPVVTVTWPAAPSGVIQTGCEPETITVDTPGTIVDCKWSDGIASRTTEYPVRRDATPPSAGATPSRGPDVNSWYNRSLAVDFSGTDNLSGIAGCSATRTYSGPDSGVAAVTGTCTDQAGNARTAALTFQYDATAPSAAAKPDRRPDRKGWYNHKVTVDFVGSDATSGISSCAPSVTYAGPDSGKTAVSGTCTDRAANTSTAAAYELRFDSRAPVLARVKAVSRRKSIALEWRASDDATSFAVLRRPGLHGARFSTIYTGPKDAFVDGQVAEGVLYRYTVTASDDAGNEDVQGARVRALADGTATVSKRTTATSALRQPVNGARVAHPPLLAWREVSKASYYNVQLFRGSNKILTAWPTRESLRLNRTWKFDGRTHRLTPGRYRWYVWPGFGKRAASRYGKLLGTSSFLVTR